VSMYQMWFGRTPAAVLERRDQDVPASSR